MTRHPIIWPRLGRVALLVLVLAVFAWAGAAFAQAIVGPAGPMRGDVVTYTEPTGRAWCATVGTTDAGADGLPWAWFTINADPRRVFHAPVSDLVAGCKR